MVGFDTVKHVSRVASQQREEGVVKIPALVPTVCCQAVSGRVRFSSFDATRAA